MRQALFRYFLFLALASPAFAQQTNLGPNATQIRGVLQPVNGGTGVNTSGVTGCPSVAGGTWTFSTANCGSSGGTAAGGNFSVQYASGTSFAGANFTGLVKNNGSTAPPGAAVQADVNPFLTAPGPIGSGTPNSGAFTGVTAGSYAGNGATQTVLYLTQGTAAATPPANTIVFGAPTTVTSSYDALLPTLAPTDALDVWVVPSGGGMGTWMAYGAGASCGSGNIPCTNTANTFTFAQTVTSAATSGNTLYLINTNSANLASINMQSVGGHNWQFNAGGTAFGSVYAYLFDDTSSLIQNAWGNNQTRMGNAGVYGWTGSNDPTSTIVAGLSIPSADTVNVGDGTSGDSSGTLNAAVLNAGTTFTLAGSHGITGVQGTTGTNVLACTGGFTNTHLFSVDINGNCVDSGIAIAQVPFLGNSNVWTNNNQFSGTTIFQSLMTTSTMTNATSGANVNPPNIQQAGQYWNGSVSQSDNWFWAETLGTGTNPTSTYTLHHSGSSGAAAVSFPNLGLAVFTVSTLPTASTLPAGTQVMVSDANSFTPGTCTGSGSDYMIAITNGSAWSCH